MIITNLAGRSVAHESGVRPGPLARLVERIARCRDRDRIALPAQVSDFPPGHWAIRRFPAADVPYELWVFRRFPRRLPPETIAAMQLWVLIGGGLWLMPLLRHLTSPTGFALSMRQWVMTCMVSLAVLALAALRFAGVYYLETSTVRQARDRIAQARAALEAIDTGVSSIFDHFGRVCRHLAYDPQWVATLFSSDPAQAAGAFTTARSHLTRQHPRLPLDYLLRFQADAEMRGEVLAATDHERRAGQAVLLILRPFMQGAAGQLASDPPLLVPGDAPAVASLPLTDGFGTAAAAAAGEPRPPPTAGDDHRDALPEPFPAETNTPATAQATPTDSSGPARHGLEPERSGPSRRGTDTLFADFLRSSLHPIAFRRFLRLRQQPALMPSIRRPLLQYYDFLATGKRFSGALVFLSDAATAYRRYLQLAMPGLALSRQGWYAIGERTAEGCRLLPPSLGAAERSRFGRRLERLMQVAARAGSTQEERAGGFSLLAVPCLHAQGFVLGAAIPLDDLEVWRSHRWRQLSVALLSFLGLVLWLGWATASHLLDPLREVEHGLRQVARGNLDLTMTLDRDDELGDLSATFDRLLQGLRERRELGRFVSGQVDALVAARDHAAVLRPQRRMTTVLASDLREFTTLSERHPPATIVAMLNRHHQEMVEAILAHQGSVELFIGDAVIAVFHDLEGEDGPRRAVAAAREMRRRHRRILAERTAAGLFPYGMGVGIDRGEVLIGTFGREGKLEHTLLGPPRQRAEALEAASKRGRHSLIVVSPAVARACPELACVPITSEALEIVEEERG
jgi:adenylate cyclase